MMESNSSDLVVVRTFLLRLEAELAQAALEGAGVDSMIIADDAGGMRPGMAATRLLVRSEDAQRAADILAS